MRPSRPLRYADMHKEGRVPLRTSHDPEAAAQNRGPAKQVDMFDPGSIMKCVVSASGTGCAGVVEQAPGTVWRTRDHRHKAESYCILQLKERAQRDVQLQIAFSSPEAAPHTLLLYHAASNTHTFKLLGPAVHLQPHMCEGVLLTINIGAAVTVQRYVKLELHGHVVQPGAGAHSVCRLGVLQQSAAVAHAAAGAVPLPVPPLDSPASSNSCSPREEGCLSPDQPQALMQEAWEQPTTQLWQQQQQGDTGGGEPDSPCLQQPQRWAAAAAAAGVEDASGWEGVLQQGSGSSPRDDAKPLAQVRPAFLHQLATVSPKSSAAHPGAGGHHRRHQEEEQQQPLMDRRQQQQGFRDVWASGPHSDQAAPLLSQSQVDTTAALAAAAGGGLSGGADPEASVSGLPWVGSGAAGGAQSASLLQALGCLEAAEQQGQQVLRQQHLLQEGQEEEDAAAFLEGRGTTSLAAARRSQEVPSHAMEPRSHHQQQQQLLLGRSSASLGLLQLAQAVAGAVSSSLGRLSWQGSHPGSPRQQLAGLVQAAAAPPAAAGVAAEVADEGEEPPAMGWYRMREDSAEDVGASGMAASGTLQGAQPQHVLHHTYTQQQQLGQRQTGPLEQLVAVKLQQREAGDPYKTAGDSHGAGQAHGVGLAGRYPQPDSLDAAEGTASYSPPTATSAAGLGGHAAAGGAAAGFIGSGEGGMGGRQAPPASSFAQSCTVQMGVFSDASFAAHMEAGDALSCHGPAAAEPGALQRGEGASRHRLQDTASSGSSGTPAGLGAAEGVQVPGLPLDHRAVAPAPKQVEGLQNVRRPSAPGRQQQQQQARGPAVGSGAARQPPSSQQQQPKQPRQQPVQVQGPAARLHQRTARPAQRPSSGRFAGGGGGGALQSATTAAEAGAAKARAGAARAPKQPWQGGAGSKAGVVAGAVKRVQPQERGAGKPGPGAGGGAGAGTSGRSSPARTLVKLRVSTEGVVLVPGDAASPPPVRSSKYTQLLQHRYGGAPADKQPGAGGPTADAEAGGEPAAGADGHGSTAAAAQGAEQQLQSSSKKVPAQGFKTQPAATRAAAAAAAAACPAPVVPRLRLQQQQGSAGAAAGAPRRGSSSARRHGADTPEPCVSPVSNPGASQNPSRCNTPGRWSEKWGAGSQDAGTPRELPEESPPAAAAGGGVGSSGGTQVAAGASAIQPSTLGAGAGGVWGVPEADMLMASGGMAAMQNMLYQPAEGTPGAASVSGAAAAVLECPGAARGSIVSVASLYDQGAPRASSSSGSRRSASGGDSSSWGAQQLGPGEEGGQHGSCTLLQGLLSRQQQQQQEAATDSPVHGFISMADAAAAAGKLPPADRVPPDATDAPPPTPSGTPVAGLPERVSWRVGADPLLDLQLQRLSQAQRVQTPVTAAHVPRGWTRRAGTPEQLGLASPVTGGRAGSSQRSRVALLQVEGAAGGGLQGRALEEELGWADSEPDAGTAGLVAEVPEAVPGGAVARDGSSQLEARGASPLTSSSPACSKGSRGSSSSLSGGEQSAQVEQCSALVEEVAPEELLLLGDDATSSLHPASASIRVGIERWQRGAVQAVQVERVYCLDRQAVAQLQQEGVGAASCSSVSETSDPLDVGDAGCEEGGLSPPSSPVASRQQQANPQQQQQQQQQLAADLLSALLSEGVGSEHVAGGDVAALAPGDQASSAGEGATSVQAQVSPLILGPAAAASREQGEDQENLQQQQQHVAGALQQATLCRTSSSSSRGDMDVPGGDGVDEQDSEQYPSWLRWSAGGMKQDTPGGHKPPQQQQQWDVEGTGARVHMPVATTSGCSRGVDAYNQLWGQEEVGEEVDQYQRQWMPEEAEADTQQQGGGQEGRWEQEEEEQQQGWRLSDGAEELLQQHWRQGGEDGLHDDHHQQQQQQPLLQEVSSGYLSGSCAAAVAALLGRSTEEQQQEEEGEEREAEEQLLCDPLPAHQQALPPSDVDGYRMDSDGVLGDAGTVDNPATAAMQPAEAAAAAGVAGMDDEAEVGIGLGSCCFEELSQLVQEFAPGAKAHTQAALQQQRLLQEAVRDSRSDQEALHLYRIKAAAAQQRQSAVLSSLHEAATRQWQVMPAPVDEQVQVGRSLGGDLLGTPSHHYQQQQQQVCMPSAAAGLQYITPASPLAAQQQPVGWAGEGPPAAGTPGSVAPYHPWQQQQQQKQQGTPGTAVTPVHSQYQQQQQFMSPLGPGASPLAPLHSPAAENQALLREALQQLRLGLQQLPHLIEMSTGRTPAKSDPVMQVADHMVSVAAAAAALTGLAEPPAAGAGVVQPEGLGMEAAGPLHSQTSGWVASSQGLQLGLSAAGGSVAAAAGAPLNSSSSTWAAPSHAAASLAGSLASQVPMAAVAAGVGGGGGGGVITPGSAARSSMQLQQQQTPPLSKSVSAPPAQDYQRFAPLHSQLKQLPLSRRSASRTPPGALPAAGGEGGGAPEEGLEGIKCKLEGLLEGSGWAVPSDRSLSRAGSSPREFGGPWAARSGTSSSNGGGCGGASGGGMQPERSAPAVLTSSAAGCWMVPAASAAGAEEGGAGSSLGAEPVASSSEDGSGMRDMPQASSPVPSPLGRPLVPRLPLAAVLPPPEEIDISSKASMYGKVTSGGLPGSPGSLPHTRSYPEVTQSIEDCDLVASRDVSVAGSLHLLRRSEQAAVAALHMDTPRILLGPAQHQQQQQQQLLDAYHSPAAGRAATAGGSASTSISRGGRAGDQAPSSSPALLGAASGAAGGGGGQEGYVDTAGAGITSPSAEEHVSLADGVAEAFPLLDHGLLAGGGLRAGLRRLQGVVVGGEAPQQQQQQQHVMQRHQQQLLSPPPSSEPSWHSATSSLPQQQQQQQEGSQGLCASRSLECVAAAAADAGSTEEESSKDQQQLLRTIPAAPVGGVAEGALKGAAPCPLILPTEASAAPTTEPSAASASPLATPLASPLRRGASSSATPTGDGSRSRQSQLAQLLLPGSAGPGQAGSGSKGGRTRSRHRRVRSDIPQLYPCPPLDSPLHNAMPLQLTESMSLGALGGCDLGDASPLDTPLHTGLKSPAAMYRRLKGAPWQQQQHQQVVGGPAAAAAARASPTPLPTTAAAGGGVSRLFSTPSPVDGTAAPPPPAAAAEEEEEVSGCSPSPLQAPGSSKGSEPRLPNPPQQPVPSSVGTYAAVVQRGAPPQQQPAAPQAAAADGTAAEQGEQLTSTAAGGDGRKSQAGTSRTRKRWGAQTGATAPVAPLPQAAPAAAAAASEAVSSWLEAAAAASGRGLQRVAGAAPGGCTAVTAVQQVTVQQVALHAGGPAAEPSWGLGCDSSSGTSLAGSSIDGEDGAVGLGWWGGTRVTPPTQATAVPIVAAGEAFGSIEPAAVSVQSSREGQQRAAGYQALGAQPAAVGAGGRGVGAGAPESATAVGALGPEELPAPVQAAAAAAAPAAGQPPSKRTNPKQLAAQQRIAAALAVAAAAAAVPDAAGSALPQTAGSGVCESPSKVPCSTAKQQPEHSPAQPRAASPPVAPLLSHPSAAAAEAGAAGTGGPPPPPSAAVAGAVVGVGVATPPKGPLQLGRAAALAAASLPLRSGAGAEEEGEGCASSSTSTGPLVAMGPLQVGRLEAVRRLRRSSLGGTPQQASGSVASGGDSTSAAAAVAAALGAGEGDA